MSDDLTALVGKTLMVDCREYDFQYIKHEKLGEGGFGIVHRVQHVPTGKYMALKECAAGNANKRSLQREIQSLLLVTERCIHFPIFYGAVLLETTCYLAMELMDMNLKQYYEGARSLDIPMTENIVGRVAVVIVSALAFLKAGDDRRQEERERRNAALGIGFTPPTMHRDVKPQNILLRRDGSIKLTDLGLAGHLDNSVAMTNVGTMAYCAPERFGRNEGGFDVRSDVWAAGITLLELLNGRQHYEEYKKNEFVLQAKIKEPESAPVIASYNLPPDFADFLSKCVAFNREDRLKYDGLMELPFYQHHSLLFDNPNEEFHFTQTVEEVAAQFENNAPST